MHYGRHLHGTGNMKGAPGKRPQRDTRPSSIPNAPAADRSPAAKIQALRDDGSDPLTPHLMPSSSKMPEELGPSDLLMGNAATTSEAEQVPKTMPRKISSTHETTTAQIIPEHNQKPYIPSTPLDGCPGMHMARSDPPPRSFSRRNALRHSPADPPDTPHLSQTHSTYTEDAP